MSFFGGMMDNVVATMLQVLIAAAIGITLIIGIVACMPGVALAWVLQQMKVLP